MTSSQDQFPHTVFNIFWVRIAQAQTASTFLNPNRKLGKRLVRSISPKLMEGCPTRAPERTKTKPHPQFPPFCGHMTALVCKSQGGRGGSRPPSSKGSVPITPRVNSLFVYLMYAGTDNKEPRDPSNSFNPRHDHPQLPIRSRGGGEGLYNRQGRFLPDKKTRLINLTHHI
ncbi:uncharacterized protein BCR38DRAFT_206938 [Pseudomassariella vexata]|uniref:Uncharacterized protein n=1 Tax=Pseudomassariella vexata TaxID=1141098 RepID=A0A1Y2DYF2_9PEZI|nr:uncharacterized protein BCR38DRAFT_206938 [Pseudomassariella vexata]ORY64114.1 hypothetical protein BCR38DRAFT_206938 [Pseudomassariella vexata]